MQKWNSNLMFPTDANYSVRVTGAEFGASKSKGTPMVTLNFEVVTPESVEIMGEQYNIAGVKTSPKYYVTESYDGDGEIDKEKTKNNRKRLAAIFEMAGVEEKDIDWENVETKPLLRKCFLVSMYGDAKEQRKTPTLAQIEEAKKKGITPLGDVMKHPVTGKALTNYFPTIREIFALAPEGSVSAPY